jgi:hypothetical protein
MENTRSYKAGIEAAKIGNNINNSYPFDFDEFVLGYKSIKPDAKTLLDECKTPQQKLDMLAILELTKNG